MANTIFEYDKLNRLTKKVTLAGAIYYAYDASGMRTSLKDADLSESVYVHDNAGRLTKLEVDGLRTTYFHYDKSGKATKKLLHNNRVMSYYAYDVAGRLERLENLDSSAAEITYYAYTRNANGAITQIDHELQGRTSHRPFTEFQYDALERLTLEKLWDRNDSPFPPTAVSGDLYEYDAASNRTQKRAALGADHTYYSHDVRNLIEQEWNLESGETTYFEYDDAQRMTASKITTEQSAYFTYDQRDQVTQIDFARSTDADETREFVHNALGERVFVKDGTGAFNQTYWAFDGRKLIREGKTDGTAARKYRHNQSCHDERGSLIEIRDEVLVDELYPAMDQRGSVWNLQDSAGASLADYSYDAQLVRLSGVPENDQRALALTPELKALNLNHQQINVPTGAGLQLPVHGMATIGAASAATWLALGPAVLSVGAGTAVAAAGAALAGAAKTNPFRGIRPGGMGVWIDGVFYANDKDGNIVPWPVEEDSRGTRVRDDRIPFGGNSFMAMVTGEPFAIDTCQGQGKPAPPPSCIPIKLTANAPGKKKKGSKIPVTLPGGKPGFFALGMGPIEFGDVPKSLGSTLGMSMIGFGFDVAVDLHPTTTDITLCEYKQFVRGTVVVDGTKAHDLPAFVPDPTMKPPGIIDAAYQPSEFDNVAKTAWWYDAPGHAMTKAQKNLGGYAPPKKFSSDLAFRIEVIGTNDFKLSLLFKFKYTLVNGKAVGAPKISGQFAAIPKQISPAGVVGPPKPLPAGTIPSPQTHTSGPP